MTDLNDVVAAMLDSCIEHLESAAAASDDGDAKAREYHLDVVHERLSMVVRMLRFSGSGEGDSA